MFFILTGAVVGFRAEFVGDGRGATGMAVGGDLFGLDLVDQPGGAQERLGRGHVAGFAQLDVDQIAVPVDCPVQIAPCAGDPKVCLVDVPASTYLANPALA